MTKWTKLVQQCGVLVLAVSSLWLQLDFEKSTYTLYLLRQLLLPEFLFVVILQEHRTEVKPSMQPV